MPVIDVCGTPRYVQDGKVAVLYSPGYSGGGWSSWHSEDALDMMFCPMIVKLILNNSDEEGRLTKLGGGLVKKVAKHIFPDAYLDGVHQLRIRWVPQGSPFRITENDGSEDVELLEETPYYVA